MTAIDPHNLIKAMDRTGIAPKQLAESLGISLQYLCDITAGRRTLKRSPALRKRIAQVLDVPIHWIEAQDGAA